jgi:hypothetical protein
MILATHWFSTLGWRTFHSNVVRDRWIDSRPNPIIDDMQTKPGRLRRRASPAPPIGARMRKLYDLIAVSRMRRLSLNILGAVCVLFSLYFALHLFLVHQNQPKPRGPFLQSVTPCSIWVVWETTSPTAGVVEYGLDPELGHVVKENMSVLHHEVQLTGLKPYTNYYYRVDEGEISKFRTAAAPDSSGFRFVVYGDTRSGDRVHRAMIRQMVDLTPDLILHTGDLVENGKAVSEWNRFFQIEAPLLRIAPFYPTLGNHEEYDQNHIDHPYLDIFHLPGNELWYTFEYGNVRFIS